LGGATKVGLVGSERAKDIWGGGTDTKTRKACEMRLFEQGRGFGNEYPI